MRVVYRTSIIDEIIEEKYQADLNNREINFIVLTNGEWEALKKELYGNLYTTVPISSFCGITIKRE